eukprot:SAG31_NODE_2522_length_5565_cov_5.101903_5_plen_319_part_00
MVDVETNGNSDYCLGDWDAFVNSFDVSSGCTSLDRFSKNNTKGGCTFRGMDDDPFTNFAGTVMPWLFDDLPPAAQEPLHVVPAEMDLSLKEAINIAHENPTAALNGDEASKWQGNMAQPTIASFGVDPASMFEDIFSERKVVSQQASLDSNILAFFKTPEFQELAKKVNQSTEYGSLHESVKNRAISPSNLDDLLPFPVFEMTSSPTPGSKVGSDEKKRSCERSASKQLGKPLKQSSERLRKNDQICAIPSSIAITAKGRELEHKRAIRRQAVARYRQKKIERMNRPKIRYTSRKKIADCRPRVKGRFIKTGDAKICH